MRAVAVRKTGDTPELMELPVPRPAPGEVLVKLAAASANPIDAGIAQGSFEGRLPHVFPLVLGVDGTGRVVDAGEAVPDGMPADIAAALPTAGMTALGALEAIGLRAGESILIVGATGGVGVFAVQLAAARGAEVIATARPDADRWIRQLGAAATADYTAGDVAGQVRKAYPGGVDAVLDLTRDQARFSEYAALVRDGGAAVSATFTAAPELLASERIAVSNFMMQDKPDLLARITAEAASGRITVPIQQAVTLDQVPEALARNMAGGARGKTTVRI